MSRSPACGLTMHDNLELKPNSVLNVETSASSVSMADEHLQIRFRLPALNPRPLPKLL